MATGQHSALLCFHNLCTRPLKTLRSHYKVYTSVFAARTPNTHTLTQLSHHLLLPSLPDLLPGQKVCILLQLSYCALYTPHHMSVKEPRKRCLQTFLSVFTLCLSFCFSFSDLLGALLLRVSYLYTVHQTKYRCSVSL